MLNNHTDNSLSIDIDDTDKQLLRLLQTQARMSITELAERVNLSATPCARRIKRLEEAGIITGYHTQTDAQKIGYPLAVFIAISMDRHTADRFELFEEKIQSFDEVVSHFPTLKASFVQTPVQEVVDVGEWMAGCYVIEPK